MGEASDNKILCRSESASYKVQEMLTTTTCRAHALGDGIVEDAQSDEIPRSYRCHICDRCRADRVVSPQRRPVARCRRHRAGAARMARALARDDGPEPGDSRVSLAI